MAARALLDTNVLVHACYKGSPLNPAAATLVDRGLRHKGLYCIAPQNLVEFAAVVTRRRFVDPPLGAEDLSRIAGILYRSRRLAKVYPKRGTVRRALQEGRRLAVTGSAWYDLFLAATMKDAGVHHIVTENPKDFARVPGVTPLSLAQAASSILPP